MPNASGICTLFIKASYTAIPATMPLHTHGSVAASGTPYAIMPLFVAEGMESTGRDAVGSNAPIHLRISYRWSWNHKHYVSVCTTGSWS